MRSRSLRCSDLGGALIAAVVLSAVTMPLAAAPLYTVRELPPLEGDVSAEARALNARGEVVGFSFNAQRIPSALKWWDGGWEILYPARDEGTVLWGAKAVDINDLGVAVGTEFGYLRDQGPPYYGAEGAGPIGWVSGSSIDLQRCATDDGASKISNAGVVLNAAERQCVFSIDPGETARWPQIAVGRRLYENGLVLNDAGTLGQALWGGKPEDESWDRGWYVTDLSTCGAPTSEGSAWEAPWDAYICGLASTGYERSRTVNASGQYIVNQGNRAFL